MLSEKPNKCYAKVYTYTSDISENSIGTFSSAEYPALWLKFFENGLLSLPPSTLNAFKNKYTLHKKNCDENKIIFYF